MPYVTRVETGPCHPFVEPNKLWVGISGWKNLGDAMVWIKLWDRDLNGVELRCCVFEPGDLETMVPPAWAQFFEIREEPWPWQGESLVACHANAEITMYGLATEEAWEQMAASFGRSV